MWFVTVRGITTKSRLLRGIAYVSVILPTTVRTCIIEYVRRTKKKMRETLQEAARKPVPPDEVQDLYSLSSVHPIFDLSHLFTKNSKINVDIDLKS